MQSVVPTSKPRRTGRQTRDPDQQYRRCDMDFGSVLQGYAVPQLLPMTPDGKGGWEKMKPIGNTGLTARIADITFTWATSKTFRRRRFWMFGHVRLSPVFRMLNSSIETRWLVEVLRVLDKAKFGTGRGGRENLTVRLCHERFQTSPMPTVAQKAGEARLFQALIDTYDKANLEAIRNRAMFHLDYEEHQKEPQPTGDIEALTTQLVAWLLYVAPVHYKHYDFQRHFDTVSRRGQLVGRHYRRMMMMYYRAEIGRPTRRKLSPKNVEFFSHSRSSADVPDENEY